MPGVVGSLAAAEAALMLADNRAVLADHDAVGIGLDLDRPANGACRDRILVVVEPHQARLRDRRLGRMKTVERTADRHQLGPLRLEHLPDRAVGQLGMLVRLGVGDAAVEQPGVQLLIARYPQPRREEPLAYQPDLVLDLPLLPARRRGAGGRLDQVVAAHPHKAAIELALLAQKHTLDRRLHVVVDAARAGPFEKGEGARMRVEHHLLALARIGAHEQHAAVAEPDMRHLNRDRRAVDQHDLVAPVELESLARRKAQRHVGLRCRRTARGAPLPGIVPDRVVAALVTEPAQLLENPDQRQPLATRLALVRKQQVIKLFTPRINPRQRLATAFVPELGRLRPDHLAHNLPRYPILAADRLDRLLLGKIGPPDLRNRLHYQHPKTGSHVRHGSHCGPAVPGVPFGCRSPRKRGPYSMPIHTRSKWQRYNRVAWVGGVHALSLTRVAGYAMRTYSGRPKSNMRFRTLVAIATSVACRPSVCERSPPPITHFQRAISASTRARQLYPDARCQPMRPRSAIHRRCRSRCVGAVPAVSLGTAFARGGTTTAAAGWRAATSA